MKRFKFAAMALAVGMPAATMCSAIALAQTVTPPTTETGKMPGAAESPPVTPAPGAENKANPPPTPSTAAVEKAPSLSPAPVLAPEPAKAADSSIDVSKEATLTQSPGDTAASKLVGASVYNAQNENIGTVEDLIISSSGSVSAVVISVGGFLGIGEKKVALPYAALKAEKGDNNLTKMVVEGTKESLKAMPDYKYASSSS